MALILKAFGVDGPLPLNIGPAAKNSELFPYDFELINTIQTKTFI